MKIAHAGETHTEVTSQTHQAASTQFVEAPKGNSLPTANITAAIILFTGAVVLFFMAIKAKK